MGGLHEIVPDECAHPKTVAFDSIKNLLQFYWGELGREWHCYSNFDIIPDGQQVKLIPNKVIYQRPDYPLTIVPDTEEVTKQVWSVLKCEGPDIPICRHIS